MGKGKHACGEAMNAPDQLAEGIAALGLPAAYEVGGAVRDRMLGKEPKDRDFMACGITPEELLAACRAAGKAEPLIVSGQLVGVRLRAHFTPPEGVEIALARTEISTGPAHTDFQIAPIEPDPEIANLPLGQRTGHPSLREHLLHDLSRRDFTCNAMAEPLGGGELIDPYGGRVDIKRGILRAISMDTFRDDPLRILRGLSRVAQDNLEPDRLTAEQAEEHVNNLSHLPPERIQAELAKMLASPHTAKALRLARDWGALQQVMPEIEPMIGFEQQSKFHDMTVDEHTLAALEQADALNLEADLKLALLLHDCAKPHTAKPKKGGGLMYHEDPEWSGDDPLRALSHEKAGAQIAETVLERLRFPKASKERVAALVEGHMFGAERDFRSRPEQRQAILARRMLARHGYRTSHDLCLIRICDLAGKGQVKAGFDQDARALIEALGEQRSAPTSVEELAVGGEEVIALGIKPGPQVREVLEGLLKIVVGDPSQNSEAKLKIHAQREVERLTATA